MVGSQSEIFAHLHVGTDESVVDVVEGKRVGRVGFPAGLNLYATSVKVLKVERATVEGSVVGVVRHQTHHQTAGNLTVEEVVGRRVLTPGCQM